MKSDKTARANTNLRRALEQRRNLGYDKRWARYTDLYEGRFGDDCTGEELYVNTVFSTVDTMLASTMTRTPRTVVTPRNNMSVGNAAFAESVINQVWEDGNWIGIMREAWLNYHLFGNLIVKVTYEIKVVGAGGKRKQTDPTLLEGKTQEEIDDLFEKSYKEAKRLNLTGVEAGSVAFMSKPVAREMFDSLGGNLIAIDRPVLDNVHPSDFIFDMDVKRFRDTTWIAHRYRLRRSEARYRWGDKADRLALHEDDRMGEQPSGAEVASDPSRVGMYDDHNMVTVWEYWDLLTGEVGVISPGEDDEPIEPWKPIPYLTGHPFIFETNHDSPRYPLGIGDVEVTEGLVLQQNRLLELAENQMLSAQVKYAVNEKYATEEFREDIADPRPGVVVRVSEEYEGPISSIIHPIQPTQVTADLFRLLNMSENYIYRTSGIADYQRGGGALASTATEAAIISDAVESRFAQKMTTLESSMGRVSAMAIRLIQQYMSLPRQTRLGGVPKDMRDALQWREGDPVPFLMFTRQNLAGDFDFNVEVGSTQPLNEANMRAMAQQLMNMSMPFVQMGVVDPGKLYSMVVNMGFRVVDPTRLLNPGTMQENAVVNPALDKDGKPKTGIPAAAGLSVPNPGGEAVPGGQPGGGSPISPGLSLVRNQNEE
jgi:hypothetical protein